MEKVNKFEWQRLVASEYGPASTTRHVLLTLSVYMNKFGDECFPSTKTLAKASGLSERTICTHLENARSDGWIEKMFRRKSGKNWRRHKYKASIPEKVLKKTQHHKGTEKDSAPNKDGTEYDPEGAEAASKGTEPDNNKVLKEVQSTITPTTTDNISKDQIGVSTLPSNDISEKINLACGALIKISASGNKEFDALKFVDDHIHENFHPEAILTGLESLIKYWDNIRYPWTYVRTTVVRLSQNYRERDHIEQSQQFKEKWEPSPEVQKLISNIGQNV